MRLSTGAKVPFIPMETVVPGERWVRPSEWRTVGGSGSKFEPGDTLSARITPCLENGKIAQYAGEQPGLGSTEFFVLRAKPKVADPLFVYYFALQTAFRARAVTSMTGASGRQRANADALSDFECTFPSLGRQRLIAATLGAYDYLAENNRRRAEILEATARALHRHQFHAVGLQTVTSGVSSDLPLGWKSSSLRNFVEINPKVVVSRDGEKPFVSMAGLSNDSMIVSDIELRAGNSGSKFRNGDTLFARITPCLENGKTGFVQFLSDSRSVAFGSTEFIVLRSKTLTPEFVYLLARSDEFRSAAIKSMSGASGRQRVQEQCFDTMSMAQPPAEVLSQFSEVVRPMFRLIHQLHLQNLNVRTIRDLLLPSLLSGQLSPTRVEGVPVAMAQASTSLG